MTTQSRTVPTDRTAVRAVQRTITVVVFIIAGLVFSFGFSNGWAVGLALGVPGWSAPLVAPAVDLSVATLLVSIQYLRSCGITASLAAPRLLLFCCGATTLALNTVRPLLMHQIGRACFDAVAPLLLIGWSEVGPKLLILLRSAGPAIQNNVSTVPDEDKIVPNEKVPSAELVATARQLDAAHRVEANRPITRDKLRAQLQVSSAVASELIRIVRTVPDGGASS